MLGLRRGLRLTLAEWVVLIEGDALEVTLHEKESEGE